MHWPAAEAADRNNTLLADLLCFGLDRIRSDRIGSDWIGSDRIGLLCRPYLIVSTSTQCLLVVLLLCLPPA